MQAAASPRPGPAALRRRPASTAEIPVTPKLLSPPPPYLIGAAPRPCFLRPVCVFASPTRCTAALSFASSSWVCPGLHLQVQCHPQTWQGARTGFPGPLPQKSPRDAVWERLAAGRREPGRAGGPHGAHTACHSAPLRASRTPPSSPLGRPRLARPPALRPGPRRCSVTSRPLLCHDLGDRPSTGVPGPGWRALGEPRSLSSSAPEEGGGSAAAAPEAGEGRAGAGDAGDAGPGAPRPPQALPSPPSRCSRSAACRAPRARARTAPPCAGAAAPSPSRGLSCPCSSHLSGTPA